LGEILETTHKKSQKEVFGLVRGYYPKGTRFIVLPMDMTHMGRGRPARTIDQQHSELIRLRECYPEAILFAAVDPRRLDVDKTIEFLESHQFRGIKLYPPLGYHPNDPTLEPLYSFAEDRGLAVMTHCSRPAGVQYRGKISYAHADRPDDGRGARSRPVRTSL
jgi:predicted TIM-barrel fold metal-dependent hydrolase